MARRLRIKQAIVLTLLIIIVTILVFPFIWMLSTAFKGPEEVFTQIPRWIPLKPTLMNFNTILFNTSFPRYFLNSVVVGMVTMVIALAVTIFAGYALSRYNFRGKTAFSMWLLVSQMFPPVLMIIPIFVLMLQLKLVNTYASLIITYATFALPFSTWMLKAYFDTVPIDLEEAAKVDGCNQFQALTKIILPLAAPGIVTVALFIFILAWHEFMFALTLTSTTEMRTLPVGISLFLGEYRTLWGQLMAGSVIVTAPVVVFFVYLQRYIVQGLTLGAVKG
ncbi:MAG: carbohydrate ABC transporter permease [Chloroflexi bacterium]|nr:carbohydrate ABC transporter permease [Chloroflexota bacterium]